MPDNNSNSSIPHRTSAAQSNTQSNIQNNQSQQTTKTTTTRTTPLPLTVTSSSSLNILPSNRQTVQGASSGHLPSPPLPSAGASDMTYVPLPVPGPGQDNTGVGAGPGPLRHPRPLTAAELYAQLEQEQEMLVCYFSITLRHCFRLLLALSRLTDSLTLGLAQVNRLSRDLTMLRMAQNASVASNASSASASTSAADQLHPSSFTDTHLLSGPGFPVPTSRRHHRTSSTASIRSVSQAATQGSSSAPIPIPQSHSGTAASVLEAARNPGMSRQNSTTSHRSSSRNRSPQPYTTSFGLSSSSYSQSHGLPQDHPHGYFSRDRTSSSASAIPNPGPELSPGLLPATLRYEETAYYRNELDVAKRENDMLKKRVKELEKMLRERKDGDAGHARVRSESSSATNTSVSMSGTAGLGGVVGGGAGIAGGRRDERRAMDRTARTSSATGSVAVGVSDEELKVGESAANTGVQPENAGTQSRDAK